ncbi:MAG: NUDIX domain-containing protein [Planctomycetota bacterium]
MTSSEKGSKFAIIRPPDDNRDRLVCSDCGWIHYENPRIIVGAVVRHGGEILFCRRAIRPRYGFWTIPGGFMELGESPEQGAQREVFEEAGARVHIDGLLGIYAVPRIGQVHLIYQATLIDGQYQSGTESLDTQLFPATSEGIPWHDLAFPVNHWTLRDFLSLNGGDVIQPFTAKPEDLMQRMSPVDYHPEFPPPDASSCAPGACPS